jgi:hypothetical protein
MPSTVVLVTAIAAFIGFTINIAVMSVILRRGKRRYHLLFALLLFIAAFWDLTVFLIMIRNRFPNEIMLYQTVGTLPFIFFPAVLYHFTSTYLNREKRSVIGLYAYCTLCFTLASTGVLGTCVIGVIYYSWGAFGRLSYDPFVISWFLVYHLSIYFSCWLLLKARKLESSPVNRRHIEYIVVSFIVFSVAQVKMLAAFGVDSPFVLPLGILLTDLFGALIGVAIIKHRLFDITLLVKKGIIYSVLAAIIIFIFDFSQHLIAAFLGEMAGEHSAYIHFASIAVVVIAFMPLKQRLEHMIGGAVAKKKIEF